MHIDERKSTVMRKTTTSLIMIVLLSFGMVSVSTSSSIGGYYGPAPAAVTYTLRCFSGTIDDQSYANGAVINSAALGCSEGSLTVTDSCTQDATATSSYFVPSATPNCYTTLGYYGSAITKQLGLALLMTSQTSVTGAASWFGLCSSANICAYNATNSYQWQSDAFGSTFNVLSGAGDQRQYWTYTESPEEYIFVLGGYDSSGVPWRSGQTASSYLYGMSFYRSVNGGSFELLWKSSLSNTSPLYVSGNWYKNPQKLSNILISSLDFSAVLQPTHLSLFASDGELSDYVPTVGTGWTETSGDWDTASGVLKATAAGMATVVGGTPYVIYDGKITTPASGTAAASMVLKYADATHYWLAKITPGTAGTDFELIEVNGDGGTQQMYADVDWVAETAYNVRIVSSSTSPYWLMFVNGVAKGTPYTTQGSSASATTFGLADDGNANFTFDQIALWPRTSTTYDSQFAQVGY
jgi:hypothetical protein